MTFNLNQCKPGDELRTRGGSVWYIGKKRHPDSVNRHLCENEDGETQSYDDEGNSNTNLWLSIIGFAPKVVKHKVWINLYRNGEATIHASETKASSEPDYYKWQKFLERRIIEWEVTKD